MRPPVAPSPLRAMRRVLGIDPGLERTGYGCVAVEVEGFGATLLEAGVLRLGRGGPVGPRLRRLEIDLEELLDEWAPDAVAVESLFTHPSNLRSALQLAHARGVILLAAVRRGCPLVELAPATVKKALTGRGRAGKEQMQRAVAETFRLARLPEPPDVADAIAIALAGARRLGLDPNDPVSLATLDPEGRSETPSAAKRALGRRV